LSSGTLFLLILLPLVLVTRSPAQDTIPPVHVPAAEVGEGTIVDDVIVVGNDKTETFVILREMSLHPGDAITRRAIDYDRDRIYSLRLFNSVDVTAIPTTAGKATIVVEVNERWYIFPYPILGIRDRDWSKVYYGAGVVHSNFRGRNEKLSATVVLGYDPSFALAYRNSFLDDAGTWFLDARTSYSKVRNRSPEVESLVGEYEERHFSALANVGRRYGRTRNSWLTLGYRSVTVPGDNPVSTISPDGSDRFPVIGLGYAYDTRDLAEYPSHGTFAQVTANQYGFPGADVNFHRLATDLRHFQPIAGGLTAAARVYMDLGGGGTIPAYSRVYIGYGDRIRGHFQTVIEGENLGGATVELHYPVLPSRYVRVPALPDGLNVWRLGVSAAVFGDAGTAWFRDEKFSVANLTKGYGGGLHFLLPYSIVLRVEYAWNEAREGEVIIDLGAVL
jgi:outer membrane protein assembly factor BamA